MLEDSGLDAGKFRIVQLPSIWICAGGTGLTKPSITPPRSATQASARASTAPSNRNAKGNKRNFIQLPRGLVVFEFIEVMYALVPLSSDFVAFGTEADHLCGPDFGGPAVMEPIQKAR
jgi:hypothetical protein